MAASVSKAVRDRRARAAKAAEKIPLKLAHPLLEGNPFTEKAEAAAVGDEVKLTRQQARHLISAGYIDGVDPEDPEAVHAALRLDEDAPLPPEDNSTG